MILNKIPNVNISVFVAKVKNYQKSPFLNLSNNLNILAGERKDLNNVLHNKDFDILLAAGFPWLIPVSALFEREIPSFNIHPSILPRYWGPDPIRNQIIKGDSYFGVTIHYLSSDFDSGEIISQRSIKNDSFMCINEVLFRLGTMIIPSFHNLLKKDFNFLIKKQKNQKTNTLIANDYAPSINSNINQNYIVKKKLEQMKYRLDGTDTWKEKLCFLSIN
jgi:methionyl-tRNA formyltransferase